jgi:hypothetical protein
MLPCVDLFSLAGSFRYFSFFWVVVALYVAWVCFAWIYFLLEPFLNLQEPEVPCTCALCWLVCWLASAEFWYLVLTVGAKR